MNETSTAHKRIQSLYDAEMRGMDPRLRSALGRRLEVDARFRAIENYLEFQRLEALPQPVEGTHLTAGVIADAAARYAAKDSPGLAGSVMSDLAEAALGDSPSTPSVGRHGGPGEVCGCDEAAGLRERLEALQTRLGECDEGDSAALHELRAVIDDRIGWADDEQQEAGNYLARLHDVAIELTELRPLTARLVAAEASMNRAHDTIANVLAIIAAARDVGFVSEQGPGVMATALERLAKALTEYDDNEIPF